ncbi:hypothetical protein EB796_009813 [Bugula neritina]|uniref:Tetratricopeptide SHNi-TPR domain-containing protein n=1 Tax=Bugula neritina TaxID=10212 RepID=A0A7J7K1R8_BUGNE|nr:hypothetical protein EB796_009813 [Bugula neritina]
MIENAELPDQGVNEKLSEVYRALGEVKLEDSDYEQAIEDLLSCLQIQKECFTEDNRYLAETYFSWETATS